MSGPTILRPSSPNKSFDAPGLAESFRLVYAATPWPVLMFGVDGQVIGASDDADCAGTSRPADLPLRQRAPHYVAMLHGAAAWLTPQEADSVRTLPSGETVRERLYLRRTDWGSCLTIVDQGAPAALPATDPQTARLAALGFMVAGVCHEITNPLTSLHSVVQILRAEKQPGPELLGKGLNNIAINVKRILDISRRLVSFARVADEPRTRFAVDEAVDEALYVMRTEGLLEQVELQLQPDATACVRGNIGQLREIFLNLMINAVQAMQGPGVLSVVTRRTGPNVEVLVTDTGPGVPPAHRERIFEPFFTTKGATHGTGLGLVISNEIAVEHGGTIELRDTSARGAAFCVVLPQASP